MSLSIGIVGLPNVGKSTTFNALTSAQNAAAENYPFCTIDASKAIVPIPDKRLDKLAEIVNPKKVVQAVMEFVDIAGLVEGASRGEGLGNKFLANIREVDAILHVVRCFDDNNIIHVTGKIDPLSDIEIINTELIIADLQTVEKRVPQVEKLARGDKSAIATLDFLNKLAAHLNENRPASTFLNIEDERFIELNKEMRLLTTKPVIFAANVDDAGLGEINKYEATVINYGKKHGAEVIKICSKIEEEMIEMPEEERLEFLESLGSNDEVGLTQIIRRSYDLLGLQSYFTAGVVEVRAWTIHKGWKAPKAASVIHNDFEKGFIRAEIISYDKFVELGGEAEARATGNLRTEGKEYIFQDGDVVHFLFNV